MKYTRLLPFFLLISSCSSDLTENNKSTSDANVTEHFNITISSDLSNRLNPRLYPKAVSDSEIVNIVVDNIYPKILNYKRSMNQLDQFRLRFTNPSQITAYSANIAAMSIDFSQFEKQTSRINYLKRDFKDNVLHFKEEFKRIHELALKTPFGADIWTYLQQDIDDFVVNDSVTKGKIGMTKFNNRYKNILILITDGYIETKATINGYNLTGKKIDEFRTEYNKSGEKSIESFFLKNPRYRIHSLNNPLLKNLEIIVLELYDRTQTASGTTKHPTDLEIMKLIWSDWFKRSGVKRFQLHSKFPSKAEAEKTILKFIGV